MHYDADAGGDGDALGAVRDGLELAQDHFRQTFAAGAGVEAFDQQHKFVAASAAQQIGAADVVLDASRDLTQQQVAGRVAALGVDAREVVEAEMQQAHPIAIALGLTQRVAQPFAQQVRVAKPGQVVVQHFRHGRRWLRFL